MIRKEVIEEVVESQKDWILRLEKGIRRELLPTIDVNSSRVLVISGIRRCGKSTLLGQILDKEKKVYYLNLEDPRLDGFELKDFNKIEEVFNNLYGKNGTYLFDEIQNVDSWEKFIRSLVDKKNKVVITGSNASLLSRELGTKLTGRHKRVELFPFSYKEFLDFLKMKPSIQSFEKFMYKGGFPEYLNTNDETYLNDLLRDIIMRDVAVRFGIKNTSILEKISIYLLSNVGKEFSFNSIKNMFSIKSVQSVIDYISYFENAYLLFTVPMFSYSYKKQLVNSKKVYSIDNGFSYVNTVSFSKDKGRMLENCVFLYLRKYYKDIFYFKGNKECDFVIKEKEIISKVVQVCYGLNDENMERETSGLLEAMEKFKLKEGIIVTYNDEDKFDYGDKRIKVIPVWKFMS